MITSLLAWYRKTYQLEVEQGKNIDYRTFVGVQGGKTGVFLNLCLFALKIGVGLLSGSVAIVADGFNNLADGASSLMTVVGFRLASAKPDEEHPFGHGRVEYLTGLGISVAILYMGMELLTSSVATLGKSEPVTLQGVTVGILFLSVIVKYWMSSFYRTLGKEVDSSAMGATATDCISDAYATAVVLVSSLVSHYLGWQLDGVTGIFVSCVILKAGWESAKDTVSPLLGRGMDPELAEEIAHLVESHEYIIGIHDLIYHDYGPDRAMMSFHVEMPAEENVILLHEVVDHIERELKEKYGIITVIHMDPVEFTEETRQLREKLMTFGKTFSVPLEVHDLRTVKGAEKVKVLFDVVLPHGASLEEKEIESAFADFLGTLDEKYELILEIERSFVGK